MRAYSAFDLLAVTSYTCRDARAIHRTENSVESLRVMLEICDDDGINAGFCWCKLCLVFGQLQTYGI